MMESNSFLFKRLLNILPDGFNLPVAIPIANNKVISEGTNLPGIQHNNIIGLFV